MRARACVSRYRRGTAFPAKKLAVCFLNPPDSDELSRSVFGNVTESERNFFYAPLFLLFIPIPRMPSLSRRNPTRDLSTASNLGDVFARFLKISEQFRVGDSSLGSSPPDDSDDPQRFAALSAHRSAVGRSRPTLLPLPPSPPSPAFHARYIRYIAIMNPTRAARNESSRAARADS